MIRIGRAFLAIAAAAFGVQYFIYTITGSGLGPPWTPEGRLLSYFAGIVLLAAGVGLAIRTHVRLAALALGGITLLRALVYYLPKLFLTPRDPGPWTSLFELLSISGACIVLASAPSAQRPNRLLGHFGRVLFAASLSVFGVQHLMYGPFIATLIPGWIPGPLFWAYLVGIAFLAASITIMSGKLAPLAAAMLGMMFLAWVLILHGPRVAGALRNANEWTSLFVALAMSGSGFVTSAILRSEGKPRVR